MRRCSRAAWRAPPRIVAEVRSPLTVLLGVLPSFHLRPHTFPTGHVAIPSTMGCCGEPIDNNNPMAANRAAPYNPAAVNNQPNPQMGMQWQQEKQQFQPPSVPSPPPAVQYGQQNLQMQQVPMQQPQWTGQTQQWGQQPVQTPQWTQPQAQTPQWQQPIQQQWPPQQNQAQPFNPYAMSPSPQPANTPTLYGSSDSKSFVPSTAPSAFATPGQNTFTPSGSPPPLQAPTPIHTVNAAAMSVSGRRTTSPGQPGSTSGFAPPADEGKLSVSIDFGEYPIFHWYPRILLTVLHRYHVLGCGKLLGRIITPSQCLIRCIRRTDRPVLQPERSNRY